MVVLNPRADGSMSPKYTLERDIDAVENAVAIPLNNGFVEGINN